jgi:hypothetical protein
MSHGEITMHPTGQVGEHNGCPVRVWEGRTHDGCPCVVLVALVGFPVGRPPAALESALIPAKDMPIQEVT